MAETQRTIAAIKLLLADNNVRAISAQDVRDFLETFTPDFGALQTLVAAETAIAVQSTFYKASGTTQTAGLPTAKNYTMPQHNRLTYGGPEDRLTVVYAHIGTTTAQANQEVLYRLAVNGVTVAGSETSHVHGPAADRVETNLLWPVTMSQNDYVELWVANNTSTANITMEHIVLVALGFPI